MNYTRKLSQISRSDVIRFYYLKTRTKLHLRWTRAVLGAVSTRARTPGRHRTARAARGGS
jgi:hypothetical protein